MSALKKTLTPRSYNRVHTGVRNGQIVQLKVCSGPCGRELICNDGPESAFHHFRDGGRERWHAQCKECLNSSRRIRHAERMATDPEYRARHNAKSYEARQRWLQRPGNLEKARAASREYKKRVRRKDPKRTLEVQRINYTLRQERKGKVVRRGKTVIDGTAPRVPLEPFRAWLCAYAAQGGDIVELATICNIADRRMWGYLNGEYSRVAYDVVDKVLTRTMVPVCVNNKPIVTVDDLYPNLGGVSEYQ